MGIVLLLIHYILLDHLLIPSGKKLLTETRRGWICRLPTYFFILVWWYFCIRDGLDFILYRNPYVTSDDRLRVCWQIEQNWLLSNLCFIQNGTFADSQSWWPHSQNYVPCITFGSELPPNSPPLDPDELYILPACFGTQNGIYTDVCATPPFICELPDRKNIWPNFLFEDTNNTTLVLHSILLLILMVIGWIAWTRLAAQNYAEHRDLNVSLRLFVWGSSWLYLQLYISLFVYTYQLFKKNPNTQGDFKANQRCLNLVYYTLGNPEVLQLASVWVVVRAYLFTPASAQLKASRGYLFRNEVLGRHVWMPADVSDPGNIQPPSEPFWSHMWMILTGKRVAPTPLLRDASDPNRSSSRRLPRRGGVGTRKSNQVSCLFVTS